ncbi:hypothetical protein [uncultured Shimia sp.]|uniref:hypothetical protein n=1 Tax=uncultured Shimia sp. TaxID=573152 RepID=UPI0025EF9AD6|nr:hypothetical protein [uncultured Shimia sp.]
MLCTLLHPDLTVGFVKADQEEHNRLSAQSTVDTAKTEQELALVTRQLDRTLNAITQGMFHVSMRSKIDTLEAENVN